MRISLIFILLVSFQVNAQLFPFNLFYSLEENPKQILREESDHLYYYNKYLLTVEYQFDRNYGQFFQTKTFHYKVKLNSDAAIEEFNKVYISLKNVVDLIKLEARIIKPNSVTDVSIIPEEFVGEDQTESYIYFPVGGLELGDELEVIQVVKMLPAFDGDQFSFQGEVPIYDFDFKFITPNDAQFNFLPQNGFPMPTFVDTILQRHVWDVHLDTIPIHKEEYFSAYSNEIMKLDLSIEKIQNQTSDYSPYAIFANQANEIFNQDISAKDEKALKLLLKKIGTNRAFSIKKNVKLIENYMKNDFLIGYGQPNWSIAQMVEENKSDGTGGLKLYMRLFEQLNIDYEYGLTTNRFETNFQPEIESSFFLQNYFFYLPQVKAYFAPFEIESRLGYLNYQLAPNYGLFLTPISYPFKKTKHEVREIKPTNANNNIDSLIIRINVLPDFVDAEITVERHVTGYDAGKYQAYYYLYGEQKKKESHSQLLNFFKDNSQFKMTEIQNTFPEDAYHKPLIIKGEMTSLYNPIIEQAEQKKIFKLGNIFGEYINIKELENKTNDFVFGHPFTSITEVIVTFPEKVTISNQEKIPQFEKLTDLNSIKISSVLNVSENQFSYRQRDEFKEGVYPIESKDELMKVFQFYSDLSKMNLIIE